MRVLPIRSRAAAVGAVWALAYLPIHVYWALTGAVHPFGELPATLQPAQWRLANWGASVLIVGAALVCLALDRPWGDLLPRWMLLGIAYVGSAFAVVHWVAFSATSALRVAGVSAAPATSFDRWNLYLFEPWFLGMGLLLGVAATQRARRPLEPARGPTSPAQRLAEFTSAGLILGGLLVVLVGVMSFAVWIFAVYGPGLIVTGLAGQLAIRRVRAREA